MSQPSRHVEMVLKLETSPRHLRFIVSVRDFHRNFFAFRWRSAKWNLSFTTMTSGHSARIVWLCRVLPAQLTASCYLSVMFFFLMYIFHGQLLVHSLLLPYSTVSLFMSFWQINDDADSNTVCSGGAEFAGLDFEELDFDGPNRRGRFWRTWILTDHIVGVDFGEPGFWRTKSQGWILTDLDFDGPNL